jgi:hypothetical protein
MTAMNAPGELAGLAFLSEAVTVASLASVIVFAAYAVIARMLPRRVHLTAVPPVTSSQAGIHAAGNPMRERIATNVRSLGPGYEQASPDEDYSDYPLYGYPSPAAAPSRDRKRRHIGAASPVLAAQQFSKPTTAFGDPGERRPHPAQFTHAENEVHMLEEAYWRKSAPDTGPVRVQRPPWEPDTVDHPAGAVRGRHELGYADEPARRSPGTRWRRGSRAPVAGSRTPGTGLR